MFSLGSDIDALVALGCDVDHVDKQENTALVYAVKYGNPSAYFALLRNGARMVRRQNTPTMLLINAILCKAEGNINATLETLTLDCNPSTPSFGNPGRTSSSGVAFKFADDSKTVRKAILEPLAMFINERFTAIKTALAGPAGMVQATKEYEKLTSQAFKVMFKKYLPGGSEHDQLRDTCKAEDAVAGGNALQQCGRCKKVRYCGRDCQAKDWKAHKPFCPK
ncbi:hypothetical protein MBLNU13_g10804t2 [Cladosporium sp. NU13]